MKDMAHVWFEIARLITSKEGSGPFLCNIAGSLLRRGAITLEQHREVERAIEKEGRRQLGTWYPGCALWSEHRDVDDGPSLVARINFCTKQIRKAAR